MAFSSDSGSFISLSTAKSMVLSWESLQSSLNISIDQANPLSHAYGINKFESILSQAGCVGIRIYNGIANNERKLILVGVDTNGNDITTGSILDLGIICPPGCPNVSIKD